MKMTESSPQTNLRSKLETGIGNLWSPCQSQDYSTRFVQITQPFYGPGNLDSYISISKNNGPNQQTRARTNLRFSFYPIAKRHTLVKSTATALLPKVAGSLFGRFLDKKCSREREWSHEEKATKSEWLR